MAFVHEVRVNAETVGERLADEFQEAAEAASWAGQTDLARKLDDQADLLRLGMELRRSDATRW